MIATFTGNHWFLSNFCPATVQYDGEIYPTSEHAFQAAKSFDPVDRQLIRAAATPAEAKALGRRVTLRPDWEQVKIGIMTSVVLDKFAWNHDLRNQLLATGRVKLVEGNNWGDTFWGVYHGQGQNRLGEVLMAVRTALQRPPLDPKASLLDDIPF